MRQIYTMFIACLLLGTTNVLAQKKLDDDSSKNSITKFIERTSKAMFLNAHTKQKRTDDLLTKLSNSIYTEGEWFLFGKTNFEYTEGQVASIINSSWSGESWFISDKTTNTYSNGLLISELYEEADFLTNELIPYERYSYSYAPSTNPAIIQETVYEYWEEDAWHNDYKDIYTVVNNKITEGIGYVWEEDEWVQSDRFVLAESNDSLIITNQTWDGENWVNDEKQVFPNITFIELYEQSFYLNVYYETSLFLLTAQSPDNLLQVWDGENWVNDEEQRTSDYFTPNQLPEFKYINQNVWVDDEWAPYSSIQYYYNEKVNPDSAVYSIIDEEETNFEWFKYSKEIYTYNNLGLYDVVIAQYNGGEGFENQFKVEFEWNGVSTSNEFVTEISDFALKPAYPNPFNPSTNISYSLASASHVTISVYDVLGRRIATLIDGNQRSGDHTVRFDAGALGSGIYFVQMKAPSFQKTQRITLVK